MYYLFNAFHPLKMSSRATLFKKSAGKNHEFERYLRVTEPESSCTGIAPDIVLDSTHAYVIVLPLSYFVSDKTEQRRPKGKADTMPYESFRIINVQHRGGNAHSIILIKSRAIRSNPHHISIFESNGRNKFCGVRILDDHKNKNKNVTKDYTSISPEYNINYGSDACNPGYCGIFSIICVVAFRHYRRKTGTLWLTKWTKLLIYMGQCIDRNSGCLGVELAARVQEIIASNACSCAEREIVEVIKATITVKHETHCALIL